LIMREEDKPKSPAGADEEEPTQQLEDKTHIQIDGGEDGDAQDGEGVDEEKGLDLVESGGMPANIASEATIVYQISPMRSALLEEPKSKRKALPAKWKEILLVLVAVVMGMEILFPDTVETKINRNAPVRPRLPAVVVEKPSPEKSGETYKLAMQKYLQDNVDGYRFAEKLLHRALAEDLNNVRAMALLASCYLNLIDTSDKNNDYFSVITRILEMARAKGLELPETLIADVEYLITAGRPEAAQDRIINYTKAHTNFDASLFYYIALSYFARGDAATAARYISNIPDQKAFSAKIFYLRGLIAERLAEPDNALQEYAKAIKFSPNHAKSRLRIVEILQQRGRLKEGATHVELLTKNSGLLGPKELGRAYYLHSLLMEEQRNYDMALSDVERATRLDKTAQEYFLQLYSMRAKAGGSIEKFRPLARMYYFLLEGQAKVLEGKYQEALVQFLQARREQEKNYLPPLQMGDMYRYLNDLRNARVSYRLAAERAPNNIQVWSKYIDILIKSFEWEEATLAMDKFRRMPGIPPGPIDKLAGDMYAAQKRWPEAQMFYKKAMGREMIDPDVYIAYANTLVSSGNNEAMKEAPFFYALARRLDPSNFNAIIGTAKAIAATEGVTRGITMLQDELSKSAEARAELLAGIADFYIQIGNWGKAQEFVDQALERNKDYAYSWKLQGLIWLQKEGKEKEAVDKALDAFKSYSERNGSDPSGYFERYRIFFKRGQFDKAEEELFKIFIVLPRYPRYHYFKGLLYAAMANHAVSIQEFRAEIKNDPGQAEAYFAMGKEYLEVGQPKDALEAFNRAMELRPAYAEAKHLAGYSHYLLKNYEEAALLMNAAAAIDRGNSLIYKRLGMAYREGGDRAGSSSAFKKYLQMEPDAPDRAQIERLIGN